MHVSVCLGCKRARACGGGVRCWEGLGGVNLDGNVGAVRHYQMFSSPTLIFFCNR